MFILPWTSNFPFSKTERGSFQLWRVLKTEVPSEKAGVLLTAEVRIIFERKAKS